MVQQAGHIAVVPASLIGKGKNSKELIFFRQMSSAMRWAHFFVWEYGLSSNPTFQGAAAVGFDARGGVADPLCQLSGGLRATESVEVGIFL